ncbi:MAG: type II toxin-antitoxin system RelB/DinJ family antitoxin [Clostridia bacterium]|nr:type II toxin-antitoxin system RelB/DinJ family antitoxin [Clostridia bacterium]
MASAFVQFRIESEVKEEAAKICEQIGIDLPTYMRICLSRLVQEKGIPFSMVVKRESEEAKEEVSSGVTSKHGIRNMNLD